MIDFPASPAQGQIFNASPGLSFVYRGSGWTRAPLTMALPKNYIVNPAMTVVTQSLGVASGSVGGLDPYYAAEQWNTRWSAAGALISSSQWTGRSPVANSLGSNTIYFRIGTPKNPLTGSDYVLFMQPMEGQRVADFQWGTANARDAVLRFTAVNGIGGTFSIRVGNADWSRGYLAQFTTVANTWTDISIPIPGDTGGTWAKDNTVGMRIEWCCGVGPSYQGTIANLNTWGNHGFFAIAGQTNGVALAADWHISGVGFYLDPFKTKVAPPWQFPSHAEEIRRCQRYWYRAYGLNGWAYTTYAPRMAARHPVPMRATPAGAVVGAPRYFDAAQVPVISSVNNYCNDYAAEFDCPAAPNGTVGAGAVMYWQDATHYIAMNARM